MKRKEKFVWISARDIAFFLGIAAFVVLAGCAVKELDKQEAEWLAGQEAVQTAVVQTVKPTPEVVKPTVEPEEPETVMLWDVPLEADLQLFIVQSCEEHHTDPTIVIAMIQRESTYQADAIGDDGEAFGLMQVWSKWHHDRMDKLGVTDLLDPFQNVTVGMDYLFELLDQGKGLEWALAAYNKGPDGADLGKGFDYAADVLTIQENLKGKVIEFAIHE